MDRQAARAQQQRRAAGPGGRYVEEEASSSSEEEDDGEIPEAKEAQFLETLLRIRRREPAIYQPDVKLYSSSDASDASDAEEGGAEEGGKAKRRKPMYLKDVLARQALEGGGAGGSDSDDEEGGQQAAAPQHRSKVKAYDREQEDLRAAFLNAAGDAEGGEEGGGGEDAFGGVLRRREGNGGAKGGGKGAAAKRVPELLDAVFGGDGKPLDEGERFLKEFIMNKGERAGGVLEGFRGLGRDLGEGFEREGLVERV